MDVARDWRDEPEAPAPTLRALDPATASTISRPRPLVAAALRVLDISSAVVLLVVTVPLFLVGAATVLVGSGRPIFFGHLRVGRGGRTFLCWKFRTMDPNAELRLETDDDLRRRYVSNGFKLPAAEDPRVCRGGRWLRRLYLDELPQLWNVLRGDMALVGPRPVVPPEVAMFGDEAPDLLSCRPGVFGEWTSRGRRRPPYPERVRIEMEWVRDPSLTRAARILARSVGALLRGQGEET